MGWEKTARRQHGIISRQQLRRHQLSSQSIDRMLQAGSLERRGAGVYVVNAAPVTYEAALWSAVLVSGGTIGFATGAHLWGMIEEPEDRIDAIVGVHTGPRRLPGIRLHRTHLLTRDITTRHGLPVTTRICSALDYLGRLRGGAAIRFADRALQQRWIRRSDIERRLIAQPGRTGNVRLREVLEITADGASAKSERLLHAILRDAAIQGWVANLAVDLGDSYCEVDVGFAELKIALEVDGMAFHVGADRFQRDRTKQNRLMTMGWQILRFTWDDLVNRPGQVLTLIEIEISAREHR